MIKSRLSNKAAAKGHSPTDHASSSSSSSSSTPSVLLKPTWKGKRTNRQDINFDKLEEKQTSNTYTDTAQQPHPEEEKKKPSGAAAVVVASSTQADTPAADHVPSVLVVTPVSESVLLPPADQSLGDAELEHILKEVDENTETQKMQRQKQQQQQGEKQPTPHNTTADEEANTSNAQQPVAVQQLAPAAPPASRTEERETDIVETKSTSLSEATDSSTQQTEKRRKLNNDAVTVDMETSPAVEPVTRTVPVQSTSSTISKQESSDSQAQQQLAVVDSPMMPRPLTVALPATVGRELSLYTDSEMLSWVQQAHCDWDSLPIILHAENINTDALILEMKILQACLCCLHSEFEQRLSTALQQHTTRRVAVMRDVANAFADTVRLFHSQERKVMKMQEMMIEQQQQLTVMNPKLRGVMINNEKRP